MKGYSKFLKAPALLEPHRQTVGFYLEDIHWRGYLSTEMQSVYSTASDGAGMRMRMCVRVSARTRLCVCVCVRVCVYVCVTLYPNTQEYLPFNLSLKIHVIALLLLNLTTHEKYKVFLWNSRNKCPFYPTSYKISCKPMGVEIKLC